MSPEYRKSKRRLVRQSAKMVGSDGSALGSCLMTDISGSGARLKVDGSEALPDQFILLLSHDGELRRTCSVVWRSETAVGVRFFPDRSTD